VITLDNFGSAPWESAVRARRHKRESASPRYARADQDPTRAGGVIVAIASVLAGVLVIAGLVYATGTSDRHKAALAAAGCEPNMSPSGLQCTTYRGLTRQYESITTPAMEQLRADAEAFSASELHSLAAAAAALTAEVASENALGRSLARFPFPPIVAPKATALIQADHALAKLTAEQARSSSLSQLRSFNDRVQIASAVVQAELKLVRAALDTPPTASQEPCAPC